jgi:hypothetical protein
MSECQIQWILTELKAKGVLIRHDSPKDGWWEIRECIGENKYEE